VTPGSDFKPQKFRYLDYAAYYRRVRHSLEQAVENGLQEDLYPEPKPHCEICRWRSRCEARWRQDDHLTLVARISKSQIGELSRHDVTTVAALAAVPLPLPWKPERGTVQSLERVREQARLQVESRASGRLVYETLPPCPASVSPAYHPHRTVTFFSILRVIRSSLKAAWNFYLGMLSRMLPAPRPIDRTGRSPAQMRRLPLSGLSIS
jgi:predicted RecB family nuclease